MQPPRILAMPLVVVGLACAVDGPEDHDAVAPEQELGQDADTVPELRPTSRSPRR